MCIVMVTLSSVVFPIAELHHMVSTTCLHANMRTNLMYLNSAMSDLGNQHYFYSIITMMIRFYSTPKMLSGKPAR